MAFDLQQTITDQILALLEKGTIPWQNKCNTPGGSAPRNFISKKQYRGVNVFLLSIEQVIHNYKHNLWCTFNQCRAAGGQVRKGEKSTMIVFWTRFETKDIDPATGRKKTIPLLRYFNVFNVAQCDGLDVPAPIVVEGNAAPILAAEKIVEDYCTANPGLTMKTHENAPTGCYATLTDEIIMPPINKYTSPEGFYSVLFHEIGHSTGHKSRLNRDLTGKFAGAQYSKEELIAEMTAAMLCGQAGIAQETLENSAAYIANWLGVLRGDKKMVISAAGAAQRAVDLVLNTKFSEEPVEVA